MKNLKRIQIVIEVEINNDLNNFERVIDQNIEELEIAVTKLRQSITKASLAKNITQERYNYSISEAARWHRRAKLAVLAKNDYLAREALLRKSYFKRNAAELKIKIKLDQNTLVISNLQHELNALEMKVVDLEIINHNCSYFAEVQKLIPESMSNISRSSAMATFEHLEEKIKEIEAESEIAATQYGRDIEQEFVALDALSNTDDELAAMKTQLIGYPSNSIKYTSDNTIDAELDELRS